MTCNSARHSQSLKPQTNIKVDTLFIFLKNMISPICHLALFAFVYFLLVSLFLDQTITTVWSTLQISFSNKSHIQTRYKKLTSGAWKKWRKVKIRRKTCGWSCKVIKLQMGLLLPMQGNHHLQSRSSSWSGLP